MNQYNLGSERFNVTTVDDFEKWVVRIKEYLQWCHTHMGHDEAVWDFKDGFIIFCNEEDYLMFKLRFSV